MYYLWHLLPYLHTLHRYQVAQKSVSTSIFCEINANEAKRETCPVRVCLTKGVSQGLWSAGEQTMPPMKHGHDLLTEAHDIEPKDKVALEMVMAEESAQEGEVASPAFPHFRKSPGTEEPLPGSEQKTTEQEDSHGCPEEMLTEHSTNLVKY